MGLSTSIQKNISDIQDLIKYIKDLKSRTGEIGGVSKSSFDVLNFALKELKTNTVVTAKGFYSLTDSIETSIKKGHSLERVVDLTTEALAKTKTELEKNTVAKTRDAKISKQLTGIMVENVNAIGKKSETLKALSDYYTDIEAKQKSEVIALNKETAALAKSTAERKKGNKERIREADRIASNKAALQKQKEQYLKTAAASKKLRQAKKDLIVTMTDLRSLLGALGFVGVVQGLVDIGKAVFKTVRELDSLDFALRATIKDNYELIQTNRWLEEITRKFGAELVSTTTRYIKFRSAAKSAGISARETQNIFETMTEVSGTLGLKTDELTGVYLALEQMISKGKITTEELRRQLGERLPGAMDIMAKSMGVTTGKLDEMLKKGEVITKDVLPAFAEEVRKTFGLTGNEIHTLNAAVINFTTSWQLLVKSIEGNEGGISNIFTLFFESITLAADSITDLNTVMNDKTTGFWTKALLGAKEFFNFVTPFWGNESKELAENIRLKKEHHVVDTELMRLNALIAKQEGLDVDMGQVALTITKLSLKQKKDWIAALKAEHNIVEDLNEAKERGLATAVEADYSEYNQDFFGTIQYLEDAISANETLIKLATTNAMRERLREENKFLQEQLDLLNNINKNGDGILEKLPIAKSMTNAEVFFATIQKGLKDNIEWLELAGEATEQFGNIGTAIFDRKLENINAEIDAETNKYDKLMALAEDDAQQKKRLEYEKQATLEKLEKERLKKEQQKAKFEKAQAIVSIAINTALGIAQANSRGVLGWWEIPVIAALGALQAATVIAQPIPQYKDGLDEAKTDHIAMINDGGKKEYVERDGKILSTDTKNAIVGLKKGDTIHKDYDSLNKKLILLNLMNGGQSLSGIGNDNLGGILEDGISRGFKKAKINNTVKLNNFDYKREAYKNKLQSWN